MTPIEKPSEDDFEEFAGRVWATVENHGQAGEFLRQYAESYHAKKCAECKVKKPSYKLFGDVYLPEQCMSCTLQCPNDCPLDKEEGK